MSLLTFEYIVFYFELIHSLIMVLKYQQTNKTD